MPTAQARVPTERAFRYLAQLTSHTGRIGHGRLAHTAPSVEAVSDSAVRITLDTAHCDISADATALTLIATSDDAEQLQKIQEAVTRTLERIGRRDGLSVGWELPPA